MRQKDEAVDGLTKGVAFLMKKNKVEVVNGRGRILAPGKVDVAGRTLETRHIIVATGSEPMALPGVEIDEERIVSSTGALALKQVPKRLAVIGGGVIGLELGSVWRRLGAEVTVVEFLDRILPGMDSEISAGFLRILKKQGMRFELSTKVVGVEKKSGALSLALESAKQDAGKAPSALDVDVVLVAIGRRPVAADLGLDAVGVKTDARGFLETEEGKTNVAGIWAIGDCTHGPMLAHKAEEEGIAVAQRIAGLWGHVNHALVPSVVYTTPEVASIGATEDELKAEGRAYKVGKFPFTANSRARTNHETDGFVKVIEDEATKRIVGVHMIGVGVGEMIGEMGLAMEFAASAEDVARTCHAHPTLSEAMREAAKGVDGWVMQA
jgi:dihydrolipoamide dehydrogenase